MITNRRITAVVNDSIAEIAVYRKEDRIELMVNGGTYILPAYYGPKTPTAIEDTINALKEVVNKL